MGKRNMEGTEKKKREGKGKRGKGKQALYNCSATHVVGLCNNVTRQLNVHNMNKFDDMQISDAIPFHAGISN